MRRMMVLLLYPALVVSANDRIELGNVNVPGYRPTVSQDLSTPAGLQAGRDVPLIDVRVPCEPTKAPTTTSSMVGMLLTQAATPPAAKPEYNRRLGALSINANIA